MNPYSIVVKGFSVNKVKNITMPLSFKKETLCALGRFECDICILFFSSITTDCSFSITLLGIKVSDLMCKVGMCEKLME